MAALHSFAALERSKSYCKVVLFFRDRPRFRRPLFVLAISWIGDLKNRVALPAVLGGPSEELKVQLAAAAWKSINLPAMHRFTHHCHRVGAPACIEPVCFMIINAQAADSGRVGIRGGQFVKGDYDQAFVRAEVEAKTADRHSQFILEPCGSELSKQLHPPSTGVVLIVVLPRNEGDLLYAQSRAIRQLFDVVQVARRFEAAKEARDPKDY